MDSVRVEAVGDDVYIVTVSGAISFSTNQSFKDALDQVLSHDPRRLVIDLEKVSFCNSQGFGDMLRAYTRQVKSQGAFALVAPTLEIRKVLEITKFARIIEVYPDRQAALAGQDPAPGGA